MVGWKKQQMDNWYIDGQMNEWIGKWADGRMDELVNYWTNEQVDK